MSLHRVVASYSSRYWHFRGMRIRSSIFGSDWRREPASRHAWLVGGCDVTQERRGCPSPPLLHHNTARVFCLFDEWTSAEWPGWSCTVQSRMHVWEKRGGSGGCGGVEEGGAGVMAAVLVTVSIGECFACQFCLFWCIFFPSFLRFVPIFTAGSCWSQWVRAMQCFQMWPKVKLFSEHCIDLFLSIMIRVLVFTYITHVSGLLIRWEKSVCPHETLMLRWYL